MADRMKNPFGYTGEFTQFYNHHTGRWPRRGLDGKFDGDKADGTRDRRIGTEQQSPAGTVIIPPKRDGRGS